MANMSFLCFLYIKINKSTYHPSPRSATVGTAAGDPSLTAAMQAAIGSGSIDYVKQTIASLTAAAKAAGADTFITGEMGYNRMEDAAEMGMNILVCGHYFTEVPVCERLTELARTVAGAEVGYFASNPIVIR